MFPQIEKVDSAHCHHTAHDIFLFFSNQPARQILIRLTMLIGVQ